MALGSIIVKKFKLKSSCTNAAKFAFVLQLLGAFVVLVFLMPGCKNNRIVGVHEPYYNSSYFEQSPKLQSFCNVNCGCRQSQYNPVCSPDGVVFYSPCFAGCTSKVLGKGYGNCSCVPRQSSNHSSAGDFKETFFTQGVCDRNCKNLGIFVVLATLVIMLSMSNAIPSKIVTIRCVADNQRPFALGLQFVFMRTLGALPGPILFGHVIDSTCQVWRMKCGERLSCADYNNDQLGFYIVAFGVPLQSLAAFFYLLSWRFCLRSERSKLGVAPDAGITQEHKNENKENVTPVRFTSIPEEAFVQTNYGISDKDMKDDEKDMK